MNPFLGFAAVAAVLTLTPGPDALLVLATAVSRGRAGAAAAALGVCTALAGWGCAAAFGLTALLAAAPPLYTTLRWAGAAYLALLGARMIARHRSRKRVGARGRQAAQPEPPDPAGGPGGSAADGGRGGPAVAPAPGGRQLGRCYLRGVLTNAANPKIGVFYLSLLPQFIPAGAGVLASSLLLAAIHVTESAAWFAVIAMLSGRLGRALRRPRVRRWTDRATGTAFLVFAARLAVTR